MSLPEYNEETLNHLRRYADIAVTAMENGANTPWQSGGEYNWPELGLVALALASLPDTEQEDFRLRLEALVELFPEDHRAVPVILYHATEGLRAAAQEASTGAAPDGSWREAVESGQWESVRHVLAHSLIRFAQLLPATANSEAPQIMLLHARHADGWGLEDRHIINAVLETQVLNGLTHGPAQLEALEHLVSDADLPMETLRYIADLRPEIAQENALAADEAIPVPEGQDAARHPDAGDDSASSRDGADAGNPAAQGREEEAAPEHAPISPDKEQQGVPLFAGDIPEEDQAVEADLAAAMEGVPVFSQSNGPTTVQGDPARHTVSQVSQADQTAAIQDPPGSPRHDPSSAKMGGGSAQNNGPEQAATTIRMPRQPNNQPGVVASILQHLENRRKDNQARQDSLHDVHEQMAMIHARQRAQESVKNVLQDMEDLQDRIAKFQDGAQSVRDRVAKDRMRMESMIQNGTDPALVKEAFQQQEAREWERFFNDNPQMRDALSGMENDAIRLDEKSRQALVELSRMGDDGAVDRERMLAKMEALQEQSKDIPPSHLGRKSLHDNIRDAVMRFVAFLNRLFSRRATVDVAAVRTPAVAPERQAGKPAHRRHPGA